MKRFNYVFIYPDNYIFEVLVHKLDTYSCALRLPIDVKMPYEETAFVIEKFNNDDPICFIVAGVYDRYGRVLTQFLRKTYPGCKLVYSFGDLYEVKRRAYKIDLDSLREDFDLLVHYDRREAEKYGLWFHTYPYDHFHIEDTSNLYDIAFIGRAKQRLQVIRDIHNEAKQQGFKCRFIVSGVPEWEWDDSGIEYISPDQELSFIDNLKLLSKAKCIVSILQEGAYSIDIRFYEALFYHKYYLSNTREVFECKEYEEINANCIYYEEGMDFSFLKKEPKYIESEALIERYSSVTFVKDIGEQLGMMP